MPLNYDVSSISHNGNKVQQQAQHVTNRLHFTARGV